MSHVWYHVSEDFFDSVLVGHHWWDFIPKVVVDQVSIEAGFGVQSLHANYLNVGITDLCFQFT
jgi:hypothetical protein